MVEPLVGRADGQLVLHHRSEPGVDVEARLVVERHRSGPALPAVAVVHVGLPRLGQPLLGVLGCSLQGDAGLGRAAGDDLLGRSADLVEGGRRLLGVETGFGEGLLVVEQDQVRHVERHRPQHAFDLVVVDHPGDVVGEVVLVGVDARLRGQDRPAVDHQLERDVLELHQVGKVAAAETGLELGEGVLVVRLVDELDADVRL